MPGVRQPLPLLVSALAAAIAFALAAASPAGAATLSSPHSVERKCAAQLHSTGTPGIARASHTAGAEGMLTVSLAGGDAGEWDLAVFRGARAIGASSASGSDEIATVPVEAGDTVVAQACRRDGGSESAEVGFSLYEMSLDPAPLPRVSLVSVPLQGPDEVHLLEGLGLDVTHDVAPRAAKVALHGEADRVRLAQAGFTWTEIDPDLRRTDMRTMRADRRSAIGARSNLPSGRDTYRVYEDYLNEMRAVAQANPEFVREITVGTTLEGRPIQGLEFATDVNRADDGRPVFANFGLHHAREWPSGEFVMEFILDLAKGYNANDPRIVSLLDDVRIVNVPVLNADGFVASRSFGFNPATDDNQNATLALSVAGIGAYRRKNCRPVNAAEAAIPCAVRQTGSGVDPNRNYSYYYGGTGTSSSATSQGHRGAGPLSEPETAGPNDYFSSIHDTVYITNHTFTTQGEWLRLPGIRLPTLANGPSNNFTNSKVTEDEASMKALGDAMAAASGWRSNHSLLLGSLAGAAEDWNYYAKGTLGYTPEGRGPNFHGSYGTVVVNEYLGLGPGGVPGQGVGEAFLLAGERAGLEADHSVVSGPAPAGATLKLIKDFQVPSCSGDGGGESDPCPDPFLDTEEHLETTLEVPANGSYEWHITPSSRPDVDADPGVRSPPEEQWTFTCQRAGSDTVFTQQLSIDRGEAKVVDWSAADACGPEPVDPNLPPVADFGFAPAQPVAGQDVTFTSASTDPDGAIATTEWDLDDDGQFDDATGLVAQRSFPAPGDYDVSVRVTDDDGATDAETRTVTVGVEVENQPPDPSFDYTPSRPGVDQPVNFRSTSTDPDGTIVKTEWDFDDDGNFDDGVGAEATTSFGAPGVYTVSMLVTDDDDATGVTARDVKVAIPDVGCLGREPTIYGTNGDDDITGTDGPDVIVGAAGDDRIDGGPGDDLICGHTGEDVLLGGDGDDRVLGNKDDDRVVGGAGIDRIQGDFGDDLLLGGAGDDRAIGSFGDDRVFGGPGRDRLIGGVGDDGLGGGNGADRIFAGPGADRAFGARGPDFIVGGQGPDRLFGGPAIDTLFGRNGPDVIGGGPARDRCRGGRGADRLFTCP